MTYLNLIFETCLEFEFLFHTTFGWDAFLFSGAKSIPESITELKYIQFVEFLAFSEQICQEEYNQ